MQMPELDGPTADIAFEGRTYTYNVAATKSLAMARCMYKAGKDPEALLDAWEGVFGANADAYWADIANDEKAAQLITQIYQERSKN